MELFLPRDFNAKQMSVGELRAQPYTALRYHTHIYTHGEIVSSSLANTRTGGRGGRGRRIGSLTRGPRSRVDTPKSKNYLITLSCENLYSLKQRLKKIFMINTPTSSPFGCLSRSIVQGCSAHRRCRGGSLFNDSRDKEGSRYARGGDTVLSATVRPTRVCGAMESGVRTVPTQTVRASKLTLSLPVPRTSQNRSSVSPGERSSRR